MNHSTLTSDLKAIWQAGVDAVTPQNLIRARLKIEANSLCLRAFKGNFAPLVDFTGSQRVLIVGAGKASAAMALALDRDILQPLSNQLPGLAINGWINCPEQVDLPKSTPSGIRLFQARPAGLNAPTPKAIEGTQEILSLVRNASEKDVVICLVSGGGSALLTAPAEGLTLDDKQMVAKRVAAAGANIEQLNCIRRAISQVKGGGLARQCRAGRLASLIISDVLGDSLETIASGPTYLPSSASPEDALSVLPELGLMDDQELQPVVRYLADSSARAAESEVEVMVESGSQQPLITHSILGNNAEAVEQARLEAITRGYECITTSANECEGEVADLADETLTSIKDNINARTPFCLITGGEPTVTLPPSPGKGGRNQQLTGELLSRICSELETQPILMNAQHGTTIGFLSGGTDGEDGPTDAAGAYFCNTLEELRRFDGARLEDLRRALAHADTYDFFDRAGALIKSGPTGTNVCDLRVALIVPPA